VFVRSFDAHEAVGEEPVYHDLIEDACAIHLRHSWCNHLFMRVHAWQGWGEQSGQPLVRRCHSPRWTRLVTGQDYRLGCRKGWGGVGWGEGVGTSVANIAAASLIMISSCNSKRIEREVGDGCGSGVDEVSGGGVSGWGVSKVESNNSAVRVVAVKM
jgi:hypothetical protein